MSCFSITLLVWTTLKPQTVAAEPAVNLFRQCERFLQVAQIGRADKADEIRLRKDDDEAHTCIGYMAAVHDLAFMANHDGTRWLRICAPEGASLTQFIQIFVNYARAHPEKWHSNVVLSLMPALRQGFPCS